MVVFTYIRRYPLRSLLIVSSIIGFIYWITTLRDSYSPEEINSLLQNKDESILSLKKVELSVQSLKSPYLSENSFRIKNWDTSGGTLVKNHDYIRLTSDKQHQVGNMFCKLPIQADSFEMEVTFRIHSKSSSLFGDGFAIWFIDQKSDIGDVFGAQNYFRGLGIFIDTYKNGKRGHFPYVNLMLGDGQTAYDKDEDGFSTRLAGCTANKVVNPESGQTKARIVYIKDGYFSLDFNYDGVDGKWKNCVTLSDVHLPQVKYLGFTAETGDISQNVDVIENKIYALYKSEGSFITSFDELEELMGKKEKSIEDNKKKNGRRGRNNTKQRKSVRRLRNAEKRIKEREKKQRLEKYGDENAHFFNRLLKKARLVLKMILYSSVVIFLLWVSFTVYRVQKQRRKPKVTGLLD
ncbi:uncharacterized protein PRCAT00004420001 [Priceomyces carsonii]|uniref:uncharacterized protein n=1 Tax=Priceomyces carsonii TaxID=28549 RepID=UPI002ED8A52C|nr:unnamed protein product [Priceomyces carsonii]